MCLEKNLIPPLNTILSLHLVLFVRWERFNWGSCMLNVNYIFINIVIIIKKEYGIIGRFLIIFSWQKYFWKPYIIAIIVSYPFKALFYRYSKKHRTTVYVRKNNVISFPVPQGNMLCALLLNFISKWKTVHDCLFS